MEQITHRSQLECSSLGISASSWTWKDVLDRLLNLIIDPVTNTLMASKINPFADLAKHCCHLLARVIAELVYQCSSTEVCTLLKTLLRFITKTIIRKTYKTLVEEFYI